MSRVFRKPAFHDLSLIVTIDKQAHMLLQSLSFAGEAPWFTSQSFHVVTQISIDRFHRIGFSLVRSQLKRSTIVQCAIHWKRIAVVLLCSQGPIQTSLHGFFGPIYDNIPTQDAVAVSIYDGQDVEPVFLLPMKVYNSSNSAVCTLSGFCSGGRFST